MHACAFVVMTISELKHIQMLYTQYASGRSKSDTRTKKIAAEAGKIIVAGVVLVCNCMLFIGCKIVCSGLNIIPVKRTYRHEWCDLYRYLDICRVRLNSPIVRVITIVSPD